MNLESLNLLDEYASFCRNFIKSYILQVIDDMTRKSLIHKQKLKHIKFFNTFFYLYVSMVYY